MMTSPFSSGNLPMPQWAYVPGETAEADADYETLAQAKLLVPPRFRGYVPARHPALRYGLALNDRGYFWEAQEILEAVWAAAPQGGRERILLRACILIASANLRLRMQKPHAAARLLGDVHLDPGAFREIHFFQWLEDSVLVLGGNRHRVRPRNSRIPGCPGPGLRGSSQELRFHGPLVELIPGLADYEGPARAGFDKSLID